MGLNDLKVSKHDMALVGSNAKGKHGKRGKNKGLRALGSNFHTSECLRSLIRKNNIKKSVFREHKRIRLENSTTNNIYN
jgi:hypothetical protein